MKGISTRKVDDLVQAMGMSGISKSQVSRLCQDIDERVGRSFSNGIHRSGDDWCSSSTYTRTAAQLPAPARPRTGDPPRCHASQG